MREGQDQVTQDTTSHEVLAVRVPGFRLRSVKVMAHVIGPDGIRAVVVKAKAVVVVTD